MEDSCRNDVSSELQSQSALVQSFWYGKSLQTAYKMEKTPPQSLKDKFADTISRSETSLSANVHKLICEPFKELDSGVVAHRMPNQNTLFTKDEFEVLDIWKKIESTLREDIIRNVWNKKNYDYCVAVKRLLPLCEAIHQVVINLEQIEFEEQYRDSLQWTGCSDVFTNCFSLLKSSNPADHNLCLLLLTSSLEHALGDVYLSYSDASQCPSLLKDLLATCELKDVFGETVISLLHILIGPPSSLNLRNVLWHGFAAPSEVPIQYASLLLVITASMSNKLEDAPFCSRVIKRRPLLKLPTCTGKQHNGFSPLNPSDMPEIFKLLRSSFFIIPSMLPLWLQSLDYFIQRRFDLCIVLLLPQLEHGLRRVFACVNNCPDRALTAESTVLYTTFDEILSPVLQDGSENLLRQEIGDGHLKMLLDVLVHPEGPRIRDHISHGEVDLSEISQESANHILYICIAFAGLYTNPDQNCCDENDPFPVTGRICEAAKTYKSIFHPISLLTKTLGEVAVSFLKWNNLPRPLEEGFDILENSDDKLKGQLITGARKGFRELMASVSLPVEDVFKLLPCQFDVDQVNAFVEVVIPILNTCTFPTLFRPKGEMEITLILRSIAQHGKVISEQICEAAKVRYEQWKSRQLRQRQRANYKRLWSQMPAIFATLQLLVVVVITELFELPKSRQQTDRSALIKFLKRCLQCSENMESLSSISKNRWDECSTGAKTLVESVEHYYAEYRHESVL